MLKKFLVGTVVALALLVGVVASASYDFGSTTLRVGSKGDYVKTLQTLVGATADGSFGPMTKAKVEVWQAANGLVADGVFGPMSMAKANLGLGGTPTEPTKPVVTGGAGDLTVTSSSKNVEDTVKEGDEEKVLSLKVEAEDSDIQITNLKLEFKNATSPLKGSEKLTDYADEVKVYLGSKEVASVDVSDFSRDSGSPDLYTKSIALNSAVVKDGNTDYLYVAVVAGSDLDDSDTETGHKLTVTAESVRFADGTGMVMSDVVDEAEEFSFKLASEDDQMDIKSNSANPDDTTVKVDENDTTDDVLALAFKLDVDEDSSDMDLQTISVTADTSLALTANAAGVTLAEKFIDSVVLKIAGEEFEAEDLASDGSDITDAGDIIEYTFEIDGDVTIDAGDVEEAKVYVTFYEQGSADANYADNTTVKFAVDSADIEAEVDGDSVDSADIDGSATGPVLTVNTDAANVSAIKWVSPTAGTYLDLFFTVKAEDNDFTFLANSVNDAKSAGTASVVEGTTNMTDIKGTLSKYSGDATAVGTSTDATAGFKVNEGDTATFRVRYSLGSNATTPVVTANNGMWLEVKVTSVAGQTVADDTQTSPTATVSL